MKRCLWISSSSSLVTVSTSRTQFLFNHLLSVCVAVQLPAEWMAAFLDKEPESRKEKAINIAKRFGFDIAPLDVNKSGTVWEISDDGATLIQPLTSIKGLGVAAIEQILANRPLKNAEELLFNENITYSKLNKKSLDALCRGGALDNILDERFTGRSIFGQHAL